MIEKSSYLYLPPSQPSPKGEGAGSFSPLGETGKGVLYNKRKLIDNYMK